MKLKTDASRIRLHGDLQLGRVLYTGKDFVLTGIGGDRRVSLANRRRRMSPLRDVAALVGSLDAAAFKLMLDPSRVREADVEAARPWAILWTTWVGASFLRTYFAETAGALFIPRAPDQVATLFDAFALEGALRQLAFDLRERPRSPAVEVPLLRISRILSCPPSAKLSGQDD
jgi:maltose alpha-D-glucosyltransferase/alpha-amylase